MISPADRPYLFPRRRGSARSAETIPVWLDVPAFTAFAQEVEDAMDGDTLRYSQRLQLVKRAAHFGIKRFDANLIIAMVQNRVQSSAFRAQESESARRSWVTMPTVAVVVVVQSLILIGGWWLLG